VIGDFQKKYEDFLGGLILVGGLSKSKTILKSEQFSQAFLVFGHFKVAFLLRDPIADFSYESLQNTLFNVSKFR